MLCWFYHCFFDGELQPEPHTLLIPHHDQLLRHVHRWLAVDCMYACTYVCIHLNRASYLQIKHTMHFCMADYHIEFDVLKRLCEEVEEILTDAHCVASSNIE